MNIFIVGINSALGAEISKIHFSKGDTVLGFYNNRKDRLQPNIKNISIQNLFSQSIYPDIVYLISSFIPYGKFDLPSEGFVNVNIKLPLQIIENFPNSRVIFISSTSVYGNHSGPISEKSSFNNPSLYAQSKLAGEFIIQQLNNFSIARISALYGPSMDANGMINKMMQKALKKSAISLLGDGSRVQNHIHVCEAADFIYKISEYKGNGIFNVCNRKSYSNLEVANAIQDHLPQVKIECTGQDNSPSFVYDISNSRSILNEIKEVSLSEGIKSYLE